MHSTAYQKICGYIQIYSQCQLTIKTLTPFTFPFLPLRQKTAWSRILVFVFYTIHCHIAQEDVNLFPNTSVKIYLKMCYYF